MASAKNTWQNTQYRDGVLVNTWHTYSFETTNTLRITATAGSAIPPGNYLARTVSGSCRVQVV